MKRLDTFEAISHRDIHPSATAGLLYRGGLYVSPEQLPCTIDEFSQLGAFEESGITTYRGVIDKNLCDGGFERTVQLIDLIYQGHVIGAGETVAYEERDPNTDKLVKRYQFLE